MRSERAAGVPSGVAAAGLVDGVVLHQVLQWHHIATERRGANTVAGVEANVFWDGLFHLAMLAVLAVALPLVWRAARAGAAPRALVGWALIGWGGFHAFDHVVFHLGLHLHDIREGVANPAVYNWGFFAIGILLIAAGTALTRARR